MERGALPEDDGVERGALPKDDGVERGALPEDDGVERGALLEDVGVKRGALPEDNGVERRALPEDARTTMEWREELLPEDDDGVEGLGRPLDENGVTWVLVDDGVQGGA